jgi:uncharacterized protein YbjT (DUF2867 family)
MIVVFGGTGRVGRQIVELLRQEGKAVRVVTRDPTRAHAVHGVEVVAGNVHDERTLVRAVTGAQAIVCTVQGGNGKGDNGPKGIEGAGIPSLIGAARDSAVENFVYISSASARADSPVEFFRLKFEVEGLLRTSGLPYSILRPTHLMDTWVETLAESITKKGKATVFGSGTSPVSWVAGEDIAKVAAALALRPGEGWSPDLGGPEALPLTEVNKLIAASLGLQIKGESKMPVGMLRAMSPLTRPFNEVLARRMQMGALLDTQAQIVDSSAVWTRFGEPLSLSAWLEIHRPSGRGRG